MSVTLTTEQFASLLENSKSALKKITKADLSKRTSAINIEEFIENFKYLNVSKLISTELPDFVFHSIEANIASLEEDELPFACSNHQTKCFYFKTNNEWIKGIDFIKKIYEKIYKNAINAVMNSYCKRFIDNDDDEEQNERKYELSRDCEKQNILRNLCNCDKYPYDKLIDKVLVKLGKHLKQ
jgi:hypothetical protein